MFTENAWPVYMEAGESYTKYKGNVEVEVTQDITTTFFVLLAIFFPSVTGIMTGANMSGMNINEKISVCEQWKETDL